MNTTLTTAFSIALLLMLVNPQVGMGSQSNTITVGPDGADVIGSDNRAIQIAVDAVAQRGGGTVKVLPGEYTLHNAIHMRSNVHLKGAGRELTVLKQAPPVVNRLLKDADRGQKQVTPEDPSLFEVGMGITARIRDESWEGSWRSWNVHRPLYITRIEDGILYLNDYIERDVIADLDSWGRGGYDGYIANIFPMIYAYEVENITIEGLTVDARREDFPEWDGARCAAVYLGRTMDSTVRDIKAVHASGDGIFIDESLRVLVEECELAHNTFHGFHPGSHSAYTTLRRSRLHHNGSDGLYICWGIHDSEFTDNVIHHNGIRPESKRNGISIGHKDTDNLIAGNHIFENAVSGIHFRTKTEANGAHRNTISGNIIENNGLPDHSDIGYGVYINGITHGLVFEGNVIRETRQGKARLQHHAFHIEPDVARFRIVDNEIGDHPGETIVNESACTESVVQALE